MLFVSIYPFAWISAEKNFSQVNLKFPTQMEGHEGGIPNLEEGSRGRAGCILY